MPGTGAESTFTGLSNPSPYLHNFANSYPPPSLYSREGPVTGCSGIAPLHRGEDFLYQWEQKGGKKKVKKTKKCKTKKNKTTKKKTNKKLKGGQNGSNYYYQFSGIDRPVTPQLRGSFEPIQVKPFVNPFYSLLNGGKKKTKKNKTKKNKTKKCKCKCKCPYCNCC
jgi:hypothetical protein